jgi:multiple sugar transport system substrate-binding protein
LAAVGSGCLGGSVLRAGWRLLLLVTAPGILGGCAQASNKNETVLTFSGSALGAEGTLVAKQLKQFMVLHPDIRVELQRTPDDASQRHQLYVQWLNARVGNPDILQLDVVGPPDLAAAGWVLPLTRFSPPS